MSDDPIERAARALRTAQLALQGIEAAPDSVLTPNERKALIPQVRAVVAALRKPSEFMLEGAEDIAFPEGEDVWTGPKPEETWPVMIDRLLWEPKEK